MTTEHQHPFAKSHVSVLADQRAVIVDEQLVVCMESTPEDFVRMQWRPTQKPEGLLERRAGNHVSFADFSIVAPYVELWRTTKERQAAFVAKAEAERRAADAELDAKTKQEQAARAALEAEQKRQSDLSKPYQDAIAGLAATDHEILKAMEAKMGDALPTELVKKRIALRKIAKAEKAKLER